MKHFILTALLLSMVLVSGPSVQAQTGDCSTPINARPSGVSAQAVGRHTAIIRWQGVPGAKGYAVDFGLADQDPKRWPTFMICDAKEEYTLTGLAPGQTYRARVRTLCAECSRIGSLTVSDWSVMIEFTTPRTPLAPSNPSKPVDPNAPVAGRYVLAGQVIDAWHRPVEGARVKRGRVESQTDAQGRFTLTVNEARPAATEPVLVLVEKDGYWRNPSRQYLHAQDTTVTMLMLREQAVTNRVDATQGGEMLYQRFSLQLPPNGVQTEDGTPYTGTILLSVNGATPSERDFGLRMPGGDFAAIDANGSDVMLYSYGFLSAEMTTESGQKLEFRPGVEATLRFNLPWNEEHRPDSVPLWHFNETTAIWEQEGWSVKNGSVYEGKVSHFSSWNCDIPAERGKVIGRVIDCNNEPVKGGWVRVGQRDVVTDVEGRYWTFVPGDVVFNVSTQSDTLRDISVLALQARNLADLTGADFGGSAAYNPLTQTLKVYLSGNVPENLRLSIDGGQTWTEEREWTGVSDAPDEIRFEGGCTNRLRVLTLGRQEDCRKLSTAQLWTETTYQYLNEALDAEHVYRLYLNDGFAGEWDLLLSLGCLHDLRFPQNLPIILPENIGSLANLQNLSFSLNELTSLPESFGNLVELRKLSLTINELTSLPQSFGNLRSLEELYIYENQLTFLPENIGNLIALKVLVLNNNLLRSLPESIGNLISLQGLALEHNQLISLPESTGSLISLNYLYLNNNQLTSLPENFGNLVSLNYLHLNNNQLTSLPENIGNFTSLVELVLRENKLHSIPESISSLMSLKTLDLGNNNLNSVPNNIGNLASLEALWLNDNQLTDLPASIANLADTLKLLFLKGTPIPANRRPAIQAMLPNTVIYW